MHKCMSEMHQLRTSDLTRLILCRKAILSYIYLLFLTDSTLSGPFAHMRRLKCFLPSSLDIGKRTVSRFVARLLTFSTLNFTAARDPIR